MSLYMQIWTYLDHAKTGKACTNTYAGILVENEIKGQAFPNVRDLLSVKDKQAVKEFESTSAVVYISGKGHRQWPSVAESTMVFIAKCVGKAREEFLRQIAVLRLRQKAARKEDEEALREAAREASRRQAKGEEPGQAVTLDDIQVARQKEDHLRYWTAPFRWGPRTREGPPLERLIPLISMTEVLTVPVSGGKAEADCKLWPECHQLGTWSDAGEPERWNDMWRQRNNRPHDIWATQGVGEGLPILVPLAKDPRSDRLLMDQLVDTGSRTVEGMAAMNGEMIRRMGEQDSMRSPLSDLLSPTFTKMPGDTLLAASMKMSLPQSDVFNPSLPVLISVPAAYTGTPCPHSDNGFATGTLTQAYNSTMKCTRSL